MTSTLSVLLLICVLQYQSPGDSIGTTAWDFQVLGSMGQRIMVDAYGQVHLNWTKMDTAQTVRYCAWNGRFTDGSYYGETQASTGWSGFVQLDITRDVNPDSQRTVIAYYYNDGTGQKSWIDIDGGNLWGAWLQNPVNTGYVDYIIPYVCVASNNNIIMATAISTPDEYTFRLFLTTDLGQTWSLITEVDSCCKNSQFVRASHNPGSHKVAFVLTRFITDTLAASKYDNNVWYMYSTDEGLNWSSLIQVTDYQPFPGDSVRAYCEVNAVFDAGDNLHITWTGQKVDSTVYHTASKIFHWDEASDSITVVNSPSTYYSEPGGWWVRIPGTGYFSRMPAEQPQLVIDTVSNWLYCFWHGNDDPGDYSQGGYYNGEIYGAHSTDNGLTWSNYHNITNTRTPGAVPGACLSEESMTASPYVVNDSIYITFIEDKDAGYVWTARQRDLTDNIVRCWIFHEDLISGVEEQKIKVANDYFAATIFNGSLVLPKGKSCRIFDISGRIVVADRLKPGIYFIEIDGEVAGKVIKIK
ncbi:MAG: hypothetical protein WBB37_03565 [bacterium]